MRNSERSGSGGRDDWRVRLTTGVGVAACMGGTMLLGPVVGINGFWPGMLAIAIAILVGIFLGRFVSGLLFRPSSEGPPDSPPAIDPASKSMRG